MSCFHWLVHKHHCEYGLIDFFKPFTHSNSICGPWNPSRKTKAMRLLAKGISWALEFPWRNEGILTKKVVVVHWPLKRFYLHPTIVEIRYAAFEHPNKLGLIVHGNIKSSYRSTFPTHVLEETKAFVLENLWLSLSTYQVMNKHKAQIKEIMENNRDLTRDLLLSKQDIWNLIRKFTKKTYKKYENDAKRIQVKTYN